jgi:hypothetical protein
VARIDNVSETVRVNYRGHTGMAGASKYGEGGRLIVGVFFALINPCIQCYTGCI